MTSLDNIGVQVEQSHGNVEPLLHEIVHALDRLIERRESTVIDLSGLPFAPGEVERLEARLGRGELNAELDALGASSIRETAFPGVWWLEHRNTNGELMGRYIEITHTPQILAAQDADISAGRASLDKELGHGATNGGDGGAATTSDGTASGERLRQ